MKRHMILEQLARNEITREEAEHRIAELEEPLPQPPQPGTPSRGGKGLGKGCLVALIVGAVGLILLPVLIVLLHRATVPVPTPTMSPAPMPNQTMEQFSGNTTGPSL